MNKRRFSRFPLATRAKIFVAGEDRVLEGETENVSLKGLFLRADVTLPINQQVEIEIPVPDDPSGSKVRIKAVVVRHQDGGMGLEFAGMDFDCFFSLQNIVSRVSGSPGLVAREIFTFVNNE